VAVSALCKAEPVFGSTLRTERHAYFVLRFARFIAFGFVVWDFGCFGSGLIFTMSVTTSSKEIGLRLIEFAARLGSHKKKNRSRFSAGLQSI